MRLFVAGASGRTGRLFVGLALDRGHEVTAFVRKTSRFHASHERLHIIRGDILAADTLPAIVAEHDAIVSMVAPRPRNDGRVYVEGTRNLASAAKTAGVRRLVVVSAEGAGIDPGELPLLYRIVIKIPVVARLYPDLARMEAELVESRGLDWTIVRAAVLTNGRRTGAYRVVLGSVVPGGLWVSRADLAEYLLDVVENGRHVRERVALAH